MLYPNISEHADVIGLAILTGSSSLVLGAVNAEGVATGTLPPTSSQIRVNRGESMAELTMLVWQGGNINSL